MNTKNEYSFKYKLTVFFISSTNLVFINVLYLNLQDTQFGGVSNKMFESFAEAVTEWSAIIGLCMIVGSVIYTCFRVAVRNRE